MLRLTARQRPGRGPGEQHAADELAPGSAELVSWRARDGALRRASIPSPGFTLFGSCDAEDESLLSHGPDGVYYLAPSALYHMREDGSLQTLPRPQGHELLGVNAFSQLSASGPMVRVGYSRDFKARLVDLSSSSGHEYTWRTGSITRLGALQNGPALGVSLRKHSHVWNAARGFVVPIALAPDPPEIEEVRLSSVIGASGSVCDRDERDKVPVWFPNEAALKIDANGQDIGEQLADDGMAVVRVRSGKPPCLAAWSTPVLLNGFAHIPAGDMSHARLIKFSGDRDMPTLNSWEMSCSLR